MYLSVEFDDLYQKITRKLIFFSLRSISIYTVHTYMYTWRCSPGENFSTCEIFIIMLIFVSLQSLPPSTWNSPDPLHQP